MLIWKFSFLIRYPWLFSTSPCRFSMLNDVFEKYVIVNWYSLGILFSYSYISIYNSFLFNSNINSKTISICFSYFNLKFSWPQRWSNISKIIFMPFLIFQFVLSLSLKYAFSNKIQIYIVIFSFHCFIFKFVVLFS